MSPIFIASQPRSGSTLLQTLLSNHPKVATASEPWIMLPLLSILDAGLCTAKYDHPLAVRASTEFLDSGNQADAFRSGLRKLVEETYHQRCGQDAIYFLDKTPRYYLILDSIRSVFPEAKILVLKRNPFAVLSSILDFSKAPDDFQKLYVHRTDILSGPRLIQEFATAHAGDPLVRVLRYEDLAGDPDATMREICDWLHLDYHDDLLEYSGNRSLAGTYGDKQGISSRSRPDSASLDRWKSRLSQPYWRKFFQGYSSYLGEDFLHHYGGYHPVGGGRSREFALFRFLSEKEMGERPVRLRHYLKHQFCRVTGLFLPPAGKS